MTAAGPLLHGRMLTMSKKKDPHAVALGRKGGLKGGKARWEGVTAEQRREIARKAARARWGKAKRIVTSVALGIVLTEEAIKYFWHYPEVEHVEITLPTVPPPLIEISVRDEVAVTDEAGAFIVALA